MKKEIKLIINFDDDAPTDKERDFLWGRLIWNLLEIAEETKNKET